MENLVLPSSRSMRRYRMLLPASADFGGAHHAVHILDLSLHGAALHGEVAAPLREYVLLTLGSITRRARVGHVSGRRFEITFIVPLSEEEVEDILEQHHVMILKQRERMALRGRAVIR